MRNPSSSSSMKTSTATNTTTSSYWSKTGLKRGPWTPEEDELLSNYINKEGEGRWRTLPKRAGLLRCGKSCRLRWMNYLRPSVKRGQIAPDEEDLILRLHRLLGNRWSLIAGRIPGRTDNEIKNYWNTHLSKKLISRGIDPRTHKPLKLNTMPPAADNHANKASHSSSSKANPIPSPNANMNPSSSSGLEEMVSGSAQIITNNNGGYFEEGRTNLDQYHYQLIGSNAEMGGNEDAFSSFINSLINEDVFTTSQNQQELQQIHQPNGIMAPTGSDAFCFGGGWEGAALDAFNQHDPNRFINDEHVGR